jgi:hypothetical protein
MRRERRPRALLEAMEGSPTFKEETMPRIHRPFRLHQPFRRSFFVFGWLLLLSFVLLSGATERVSAEGLTFAGWGVRGGFSLSPDQFVIGMHVVTGDLAKNLRLMPNVDLGFGDHFTLFTLNPDVHYLIPLSNSGKIYVGGTIGLVYWRFHDSFGRDYPRGYGIDRDGTDLGVAGIVGYEFPVKGDPIFLDLKIGITDEYPDLKFMVGYTFLQ